MPADDLTANSHRLDAMVDHLAALSHGADTVDTALAAWMAYCTALSFLSTRLPASWFDEACAQGEAAARRFAGAPVGGAA